MKKKKKIHKDKNGREFIKETYFVGGKMKFRRIYVIDGIPVDEFYEKNATDFDFFLNGDYHLMSNEKSVDNQYNERIRKESDLPDEEDLPF
ncbi:hypothetical protein [Marinilabilia salmonicolor]|uniref:hypothetical protein n=1 Tax=Marinilabilia salmonicolor TaxID=989 RepID=UPI00029A4989|nr:hypothetical protein [Marinilabilia salmonicolor]